MIIVTISVMMLIIIAVMAMRLAREANALASRAETLASRAMELDSRLKSFALAADELAAASAVALEASERMRSYLKDTEAADSSSIEKCLS